MARSEADDTAERSETACSREQPEGWPQASKGHPSRSGTSRLEGPAPSGPWAVGGGWRGTRRTTRRSSLQKWRFALWVDAKSPLPKSRRALEGPAPSGPWAVGGDGTGRDGRHGGRPSRSGASRMGVGDESPLRKSRDPRSVDFVGRISILCKRKTGGHSPVNRSSGQDAHAPLVAQNGDAPHHGRKSDGARLPCSSCLL